MALGPGKYDDLATHARERAKARAAIVIVIGGDKGSGFSVQTEAGLALPLPALLRKLADDIENAALQGSAKAGSNDASGLRVR